MTHDRWGCCNFLGKWRLLVTHGVLQAAIIAAEGPEGSPTVVTPPVIITKGRSTKVVMGAIAGEVGGSIGVVRPLSRMAITR